MDVSRNKVSPITAMSSGVSKDETLFVRRVRWDLCVLLGWKTLCRPPEEGVESNEDYAALQILEEAESRPARRHRFIAKSRWAGRVLRDW